MRATEEYVNDFMMKLKNGHFSKDHMGNTGSNLTEEYVNDRIKGFKELLNTEVVSNVMKGTGEED